jgi:DNA polymerase V
MDGEEFFGAAYRGSKQFKQQEVKNANATGFGAAADDYMERGIDLNEQLIKNKPATPHARRCNEGCVFENDDQIIDRSLKLMPENDRAVQRRYWSAAFENALAFLIVEKHQ